MTPYAWRTRVRLVDTDAAGRIFFASLLRIAHEAFEEFMIARGQPIHHHVNGGEFSFAIVHTEADFRAPLLCGDEIEVRISLPRIGNSSFTVSYAFIRDGVETASAQTVHVALNRADGTKRPIPEAFRRALES